MADNALMALAGERIGRSGAITDLIRFPRSSIDFPYHVVTARVADRFEEGLAESTARCVASGVSEDPEIATMAAVGEAWERIAFVDAIRRLHEHPPAACPADIDAEYLFNLPFLLDRGTSRASWSESAKRSGNVRLLEYNRHLAAGQAVSVWVPASVIVDKSPTSLLETTNGLACAETYEVALDRAIREIVERDALMLVWLTKSGGNRILPEQVLSEQQCTQIERMAGLGIRTIVRDISTNLGIRVFLVCMSARFGGKKVGLAFGAGAHHEPCTAARHAFREACLSWRGVAWRSVTGHLPAAQESPASFADHAEYYSSWDRMDQLEFLLREDPPLLVDSRSVKTQLPEQIADDGHLERLLEQGYTVLSTEITPKEASGTGLHVVQAVIPGLVPLYIGDRNADELAMARLPTVIGGEPTPAPAALNTMVHPWP